MTARRRRVIADRNARSHVDRPPTMQGGIRRFAVALAAAALLVANCGDTADPPSPSRPPATSADSSPPTAVGSISAETERTILELLENGDIPSFAGAIVVDDQLAWAGGYGDQAAADTVYMVGSIDKSFIATAVFQLVEDGVIDLDADIDTYLPFSVRNPAHPDTAVTIEHLLLHRSGLIGDLPDSLWYDNDTTALEWAEQHLAFDNRDNPFVAGAPPLDKYLASHFSEPNADLWRFEPGADWAYSNLGVHLLLAYIIERVSGQSLTAYIAEHILGPLGMDDSGFEASQFDAERLAIPHTRIDGTNTPLPLTGQHASDRLRATATDLARFLGAHMNDGTFGGAQVLDPDSTAAMHASGLPLSGMDSGRLPFRGVAHGWWLWTERRSGHSGGTPGFVATMVMQETEAGHVGVVAFINVGCSLSCEPELLNDTFASLREVLLEEARSKLSE